MGNQDMFMAMFIKLETLHIFRLALFCYRAHHIVSRKVMRVLLKLTKWMIFLDGERNE